MQTDRIIVGYGGLTKIRRNCTMQGLNLTFTPGCFDGPGGPHFGHCLHVDYCKKQRPNSIMVVGIANDQTTRLLKGDGRPIKDASIRARMMAIMKPVDYVVINEEEGDAGIDGDMMMELLRPDLYIASSSDIHLCRKQELCERLYIGFLSYKRFAPWNAPGISTTSIVQDVRDMAA